MNKTSTLKLRRVRFKKGGSIEVLPAPLTKPTVVHLGDWGEVSLKIYGNNEPLNQGEFLYMLECAKMEVMDA